MDQKQILEDFRNVECALSPENLSCDGELPLREQRQRYKKLMKARNLLIKKLGRIPRLDEVYGRHI